MHRVFQACIAVRFGTQFLGDLQSSMNTLLRKFLGKYLVDYIRNDRWTFLRRAQERGSPGTSVEKPDLLAKWPPLRRPRVYLVEASCCLVSVRASQSSEKFDVWGADSRQCEWVVCWILSFILIRYLVLHEDSWLQSKTTHHQVGLKLFCLTPRPAAFCSF